MPLWFDPNAFWIALMRTVTCILPEIDSSIVWGQNLSCQILIFPLSQNISLWTFFLIKSQRWDWIICRNKDYTQFNWIFIGEAYFRSWCSTSCYIHFTLRWFLSNKPQPSGCQWIPKTCFRKDERIRFMHALTCQTLLSVFNFRRVRWFSL